MPSMVVGVSAVFCWLISATMVWAAERYVATNGVDTGEATNSAAPWLTLTYAVANASPGDTVNVGSGIYTESNITVALDGLTIAGAGPANTIVQAAPSRGVAANRVFSLNTNCTLSGMTIRYGRFTAINNGAGIGLLADSKYDVTIDNCIVAENDPRGSGGPPSGGAIAAPGQNAGGLLRILNSSIVSNAASVAGMAGIYSASKPICVSNCFIFSNVSYVIGGGITMDYRGLAPLDIYDSRIVSNSMTTAASMGGGLYVGGPLNMRSCLVAYNMSAGDAGGLYLVLTNMQIATIANSTFYGNTATNGLNRYGGGIYCARNAATSVPLYRFYNCTVYTNAANNNGCGIQVAYGNVEIQSCIVAGNWSSGTGSNPDLNMAGGTLNYCSNSIIANNAGSGLQSGAPTNSNYIGSPGALIDPLLSPLADNLGQSWTCAFPTNSVAYNNGTNALDLASDQRGPPFPRIAGGACDIGAFEYTSFSFLNASIFSVR